MRFLLIQLLILPRGIKILTRLCVVSLILLQLFSGYPAEAKTERDDFPDRRQGGGTHWIRALGVNDAQVIT